jgi:hypothetical protein
VHGGGPAPLAVLFELYFTGYQLFVFTGPVVDTLAFAAGELDKAFLRHVETAYLISLFCATSRLRELRRAGTKAKPQIGA